MAVKDVAITEAGKKVRIDALINDYDPDGTKIRLKRVKKSSQGTVKFKRKGIITYRPAQDAEGKDVIRYVIKDRNGKGKKARGKVVVRILPNSNPGGGTGPNEEPVADAGRDQNTKVGRNVVLDGTGSYDPEDDVLTYDWSLVSRPAGSVAQLSNPTTDRPGFVPDVIGTFVAELEVSDGIATSSRDRVKVTATAASAPPPPPPGNLASLCADPGVIVCDGFEGGERWDFYNNRPDLPNPPQIVNGNSYEGDHAFQLTLHGNAGSDVSGSVAYDIPPTDTVYMHAMIKWEATTFANLDRFTGSKGPKWFQFTEEDGSCSSDSVNIVNSKNRNIWRVTNGCSGNGFRTQTPSGDFNLQPKSDDDDREYSEGACTYRHFSSENPSFEPHLAPNPAHCVIYEDDVWNWVELRVSVGEGIKLWVNGELVINLTEADGGGGITEARQRLFLTGYMTGHDDGHPANETYRVWYDNLVISENCITSCGL